MLGSWSGTGFWSLLSKNEWVELCLLSLSLSTLEFKCYCGPLKFESRKEHKVPTALYQAKMKVISSGI